MTRAKKTSSWLIFAAAVAAGLGGCDQAEVNALLSSKSAHNEGEYTILLYVLKSADHVERIKDFKTQTEKDTKWKSLFVVHKAGHSELYWGKYATLRQAQKDLKKAKAYRTAVGIPAYAKSMVMPLPGKDIGPPEWNLLNAKGAYTVVVAVFYNVPEANYYGRKQNAVAYCRQLREKGEEAYYHHGISQSTVSIGTFPESAVRMVTRRGVSRPEIQDPRVEAIRRRFKYIAVNGWSQKETVINPKTGRAEWDTAKPRLYRIPRRKEGHQADALDRVGNSQPG